MESTFPILQLPCRITMTGTLKLEDLDVVRKFRASGDSCCNCCDGAAVGAAMSNDYNHSHTQMSTHRIRV